MPNPVMLARELYDAEAGRFTIEPLTDRHSLDLPASYAVQAEYAQLRVANGASLTGHKVGATSRAIQEYFSIEQPDFGRLFDDMEIENGGVVHLSELLQPRVEPELAFILGQPLRGPGVTADDVLAATSEVRACIEVIDSRIHNWRIRLGDTVSDNGSSARYILGDTVHAQDLSSVTARISRNGVLVDEAKGSEVLGHPANAVAWLANTIGDLGQQMEAGHVILSGSFTTAVECQPGDDFLASFNDDAVVRCTIQG